MKCFLFIIIDTTRFNQIKERNIKMQGILKRKEVIFNFVEIRGEEGREGGNFNLIEGT